MGGVKWNSQFKLIQVGRGTKKGHFWERLVRFEIMSLYLKIFKAGSSDRYKRNNEMRGNLVGVISTFKSIFPNIVIL